MIGKIKKAIPKKWRSTDPFIPVVRLMGAIGMASPLKPGLSLAGVAGALTRAFADDEAAAVALIINSPGGSPVQSRLIFKRIRDLAQEHNRLVLVFVEDVAASGGYLIALAGDEIYADPSSIIGSIGVVGATFGFDRLLEKIGVDRRVYTAGDKKVTLDPFQPERPEDVKRIQALQKDIHAVFIDLVKERRGTTLNGSDKSLFSGEFWAGNKALELGLIDGLGDIRGVLQERFGEKVRLKLISTDRSFPWKRGGGVDITHKINGHGFANDILSAVETRALWARYGL